MAQKKLRKPALKKSPLVQASSQIVSIAKRNEDIRFYIHVAIKNIDHQRILVLHVYHREQLIKDDTSPKFRVFLTKTDYISQYYIDGKPKWLKGRMETMMDYYSARTMTCNDASEDAIRSFLGNDDCSAWRLIQRHQEQIMYQRLLARYKKLEKQIDRKMQQIKPLPKDFTQWVDKVALTESRYIYYQYKKRKQMDGYCTQCEQPVKVSSVKHRSMGYCPHCGTKVLFLAESRARHITDHAEVAYFQKTPNGFVVRYFSVTKSYGEDYRNPKLRLFEIKRDFYEGEAVDFYEWRYFKNSGKVRWSDGCICYKREYDTVYTKNLKKVLAHTPYQYSALPEYLTNAGEQHIIPHYYLRQYLRNPFLENLVKMRMYQLAYELVHTDDYFHSINKNGSNMKEILQVAKQDISLVQKLDMSMKQLRVYRRILATGMRMDEASFLWFYDTYWNTDAIYSVLRYTTLHKTERYCMQFVEKNVSYRNVLLQWKDYISFCEELGYDLKNTFVLFPKNLWEAHDEASAEVLRKREEERKEQIQREEQMAKALLQEYQEVYPWSDDGYAVIVPKDLFSIKEEGHALRHCVGTYTSRVANGKSIILFIRDVRKMDKAYFTMEVQNGEIIQCRGYQNQNMTETVAAFVNKYQNQVLKRLMLKQAV